LDYDKKKAHSARNITKQGDEILADLALDQLIIQSAIGTSLHDIKLNPQDTLDISTFLYHVKLNSQDTLDSADGRDTPYDLAGYAITHRDSRVISRDYSYNFNICAQLNQGLIAIYDTLFYAHNLELFCQYRCELAFEQRMKQVFDIDIGIGNNSDIYNGKDGEFKTFFEEINIAGDALFWAFYSKRISTLGNNGIFLLAQYKKTDDLFSAFTNDAIRIQQPEGTINAPLTFPPDLMQDYLTGLDHLIENSYKQTAFNTLATLEGMDYDKILLTAVPTLKALSDAAQLSHSTGFYSNPLTDNGITRPESKQSINRDLFSPRRKF
jgi:hypothetical protein